MMIAMAASMKDVLVHRVSSALVTKVHKTRAIQVNARKDSSNVQMNNGAPVRDRCFPVLNAVMTKTTTAMDKSMKTTPVVAPLVIFRLIKVHVLLDNDVVRPVDFHVSKSPLQHQRPATEKMTTVTASSMKTTPVVAIIASQMRPENVQVDSCSANKEPSPVIPNERHVRKYVMAKTMIATVKQMNHSPDPAFQGFVGVSNKPMANTPVRLPARRVHNVVSKGLGALARVRCSHKKKNAMEKTMIATAKSMRTSRFLDKLVQLAVLFAREKEHGSVTPRGTDYGAASRPLQPNKKSAMDKPTIAMAAQTKTSHKKDSPAHSPHPTRPVQQASRSAKTASSTALPPPPRKSATNVMMIVTVKSTIFSRSPALTMAPPTH